VMAEPDAERVEDIAQDAGIAEHPAGPIRLDAGIFQQAVQPCMKRAAIAMVAVLEAEQPEPVPGKQLQAAVQQAQFIEIDQQGEDAIAELVLPGPQAPVHHPAGIKRRAAHDRSARPATAPAAAVSAVSTVPHATSSSETFSDHTLRVARLVRS